MKTQVRTIEDVVKELEMSINVYVISGQNNQFLITDQQRRIYLNYIQELKKYQHFKQIRHSLNWSKN